MAKTSPTRIVRTTYKEPVERVVHATPYAPSSHCGAGSPYMPREGYRAMAVRQGPRKRRIRRLVALLALMIGGFWLIQHVHEAGHATADMLRQVLGVTTTGRIEAAYRDVVDQAHTLQEAASGSRPPAVSSVPAPAAPAHKGVDAGRHSAAAAGASAAVGVTRSTTPARAHVPARAVRASPAAGRRRSMPRPVPRAGGARLAPPPLPAYLRHLPPSTLLQNDYQVYETWNNCGPASLSMALSYFGIHVSQAVLGEDLRPYQNAYGDNDDKDTTWEQLAGEAQKFGLLAYYRPDGNITLLKRFIAIGLPVVAETVMTKDDDIGHYRVVKGYDDASGTITQDDSMQGHNVQFSYSDFDYMWKRYNYEYMVLVPKDKQRVAEAILGRDLDQRTAWRQTVKMDQAAVAADPADVTSRFNLSVAYYHVGKYQASVDEYELIQNQLPPRTLWYQIEPIEAYYARGDYQKVFSISAEILNNGNRAFSQLYILRGDIDLKEGNVQAARAEFANAVYYNKNLKAAQDALRSVS